MMKALAAGADTIMVGSLFAGTEEAPGETEMIQGKLVKSYYGMGSPAAMKLNADVGDRYGLGSKKLVAEGVEGYVNYKGKLADVLAEYLGGIQSGMGYTGAKDIKTLHKTARFENITAAGLKESQPHDLLFIKSSSNYSA
jgi:IMP dehydrogenase